MIPFNKSTLSGKELSNIKIAQKKNVLSGDGYFTKKCSNWLEKNLKTKKVLLTNSCTSSLEMCAMLLNVKKNDEIIMPSYTFVSTANAFVIYGAKPVFIDINPETLCIDEKLIEQAITKKTKAIVIVNYGGISCNIDEVLKISKKYKIPIIEDAAQSILSTYKDKFLGTIGDLGCISFHETKNITCGQGGALLINNMKYYERALSIREKGTNRAKFILGEVDKYTWVSKGSSFLLGELNASYLYSQLKISRTIIKKRLRIWEKYNSFFKKYEKKNILKIQKIPLFNKHNAHMFYVIFETKKIRDKFLELCKIRGLQAIFHYIPLHNSPAGKKYCKKKGRMKNTNNLAGRIVRFPVWIGVEQKLNLIFSIIRKNLILIESKKNI